MLRLRPIPQALAIAGLTLAALSSNACMRVPFCDHAFGASQDECIAGESETAGDSGTETSGDGDGDPSGDGDGDGDPGNPPESTTLFMDFSPIKQFDFTWTTVPDVYYQVLEQVEPEADYVQVGDDTVDAALSAIMPLHLRRGSSFILNTCNMDGCTPSDPRVVQMPMVEAVGYVKPANIDAGDLFGTAIAVSADGNTLAIGARGEDSAATGIDGNPGSDTAPDAGAVWVFVRGAEPNSWEPQAYIKASNTGEGDAFGSDLALSANGNTLVVGAQSEASAALGVDGDDSDDSALNAGAAYVFTRVPDGGAWSQAAYLKASNTEWGDRFGHAVALSDDGDTIAVGAVQERGATTGIDGAQTNNSASSAGAVYVFARNQNSDAWAQEAYVKASNTDANDRFGHALALSGDGNLLAVAAINEDSDASGVDADQTNDNAGNAGAVYLFRRDGSWAQEAYVKASNTGAGDQFGTSVALSADGSTLAVGAELEASAATGVDGDDSDDSANAAGAAYVFVNAGGWVQDAYVKASNTNANDRFGGAIALSGDGGVLAVGAAREASDATGVGGDGSGNGEINAGAAYVFARGAMSRAWAERGFVKSVNSDLDDLFGSSVALSEDAGVLAVGAEGESSAVTGIGGELGDNSMPDAGAAYLY